MALSSPIRRGHEPAAEDAPRSSEPGRYDAFLSYAREDREFVVDWLRPALRERGQDVWVDVVDIAVGARWRERVKRGIEACKALIFVVTPASLASAACGAELEDALALHKLIIPVMREDVPEAGLPRALADVEWVLLREGDDRAGGLQRLVDALETDLEWRDQHTRLAGRAREWLDSGRDASYLLRGADLREAESWLGTHGEHREAPTVEQGQYIARSRQAAARRIYTVAGVLAVGLLIAAGLAVFALIQRGEAVHQTHAAQSRALAASSLLALGDDPELSLLLARRAEQQQQTPQALQALRNALAGSHVRRTMVAPHLALGWAWFTPDATRVVANGIGPTYVFDARTGRRVRSLYRFRYRRPMFGSWLSANGAALLLLPNIGPPVVLRVDGRAPPVKLVDPTDSWFADAAIAPDGRTAVATTLHSHIAREFDTRTGRILRTFPGHPGRVALSPDGSVVALADRTGVTTYALADGRRLAELPLPRGEAFPSIAFSPNGSLYVATASAAGAWDPLSGQRRLTLGGLRARTDGSAAAWPLAFSRDGSTVAGVTGDGHVTVWDARTGRVRTSIVPASGQGAFDVALSPDGEYAATSDEDGVARIWAVSNAALVTELRGVPGGVNHIVFSPDGTRVLTAGEDGTARIWDAGLGLPQRRWSAPGLVEGTLAGRWGMAETAGAARVLTVLDSRSGRRAFTLRLPRPAWSVAFADRAPMVLVLYDGAPAEVWDLATHRRVATLPGTAHLSTVQRAAISADGRRALLARGDTLTVWDVARRRPLGRLRHHMAGPFPSSASAFSPDDQLVATDGTDGVVVLWRAGDGHVVAREQAEVSPAFNASDPVQPAFSPDGALFTAAGNWDRSPGVWSARTGRLVARLTQPYGTVAFSPDGSLIVTDGAFVWDAETGRRLLTLRESNGGVQDAAFTPDGLHVVAAGFDGRAQFACDVCGSLPRLMRLARSRITRGFTPAETDRYLR